MNGDKLKDPNWRVENLYKIVNKEGQRVTFKRNKPQKLLNEINSRRKMILKSRQVGFSTDCLITKFDRTIFSENMTTAIIAHEDEAVEKLFRIVKRAYLFMPEELKPRIDRGGGSRYEMFFPEINSRIYCDLEIRGDTVQQLHVSEAAFMKDSSKLKATLQAVPLNTGIVDIETTPNGMGNYFYEMWNDSDQPYSKFFVPWYMFDSYKLPVFDELDYSEEELKLIEKAHRLFKIKVTPEQIAFRRFKKSELKVSSSDKRIVNFEQEYPEDDVSCFLSSGTSVLNLFILKELLDKAPKPISDKDGITIFKEFDKTKKYVCGADTSEGVGGDSSVGVILEKFNMEVVAVIRGQWAPSEFADKLAELCRKYRRDDQLPPKLAVEKNNHGHAVLLELNKHIIYENLYYRKTGVDHKGHHQFDKNPGWVTDKITRPIMVNAFIDAVQKKYLKLNDKNIFAECFTLVNNNGKVEAATGKNDDCIIATAIALQMVLDSSNLDLYDDISSKILT
jgi:hypothetical protein